MSTFFSVVAAIMILAAALLMLLTFIGLWRAPDALTRANLLGLTTSIALPMLLVASLINDIAQDQFAWTNLLRVFLTITALLVVLAIGSFIMGRSLYGVGKEQQAEQE